MTGHIEPVDVLQVFGATDSRRSDLMNKWAIEPPIFQKGAGVSKNFYDKISHKRHKKHKREIKVRGSSFCAFCVTRLSVFFNTIFEKRRHNGYVSLEWWK